MGPTRAENTEPLLSEADFEDGEGTPVFPEASRVQVSAFTDLSNSGFLPVNLLEKVLYYYLR